MKSAVLVRYKTKYLKNLFSCRKIHFIPILLLYPYIVGFTSDSTDTSSTIIDFVFGMGKYAHVTYDCNGNVASTTKYSFYDYGGSINQNFNEFKFGLRGGAYSVKHLETSSVYQYYNGESSGEWTHSSKYLNPYMGFDYKYFEANIGFLYLTDIAYVPGIYDYLISDGQYQPTWFMRIGNREKFHFSTQYLSNVPLLSGGGMADAGFGFGSEKSRSLTWVGCSFGPFQNLGLAMKLNIQVTDNFDIKIKGRVGTIEDCFEGGFSIGAQFIL